MTTTTNNETTKPRGKGPTITLGICLAAGLAAGIGLMRPGASAVTGAPTDQTAPADQAAVTNQGTPAYGAQAQQQAPADGAAAESAAIDIAEFAFGNPITVSGGTAINVTNRDGVAHTLTATDGGFDTGSIGGNGTAGLVAPTAPGTYSFFCSIHPSMQGSLTVTS